MEADAFKEVSRVIVVLLCDHVMLSVRVVVARCVWMKYGVVACDARSCTGHRGVPPARAASRQNTEGPTKRRPSSPAGRAGRRPAGRRPARPTSRPVHGNMCNNGNMCRGPVTRLAWVGEGGGWCLTVDTYYQCVLFYFAFIKETSYNEKFIFYFVFIKRSPSDIFIFYFVFIKKTF